MDIEIETETTAVDTGVDAPQTQTEASGTNSTWYDRLCLEANELGARCASLDTFLDSNDYTLLPAADRDLLQDQCNFMHGYLKILTARIDRYDTAQQTTGDPNAEDPTQIAQPTTSGPEPDEPPAGTDTTTGTDTATAQADTATE